MPLRIGGKVKRTTPTKRPSKGQLATRAARALFNAPSPSRQHLGTLRTKAGDEVFSRYKELGVMLPRKPSERGSSSAAWIMAREATPRGVSSPMESPMTRCWCSLNTISEPENST